VLKVIIELSATSVETPASGIELQMNDASERAKDALAQMQSRPAPVDCIEGAVGVITSGVENVVSIADTWDILLNKIELFTKIVDGIAEVGYNCD
jgi:hypothetical protein